jgi:hypothetical protein
MSVKVMPSGGYAAVVPEVGQQTKMVRLEAVGASGEKVKYRWYKNGQWLSDGVSIEVPALDELGVYRAEVVLMDGAQVLGSARSEEVPVQLMKGVSVSRGVVDVSVEAGGVAVFSVEGVGGGTIGYQWERLRSGRWEKVTGASGRELRFGSVRTSDAGQYRVVVSNARNGVVSEGTLTVREVEVIVGQPLAQTVNKGDSAVFEVKAKGLDLGYQWRRNGVVIGGATGSVLSVSSVEEGGVYDVVVTHAFGASLSESVKLTVREPVRIERSPASVAIAPGGSATLLVKAGGTGPFTYQWRKDGVAIGEAKTAVLSVSVAGAYDVVVSNQAGSAVSEVAVVTAPELVSIKVQPLASTAARAGDRVQFSVVASGSPVSGQSGLSYQWRKWSAGGVWENVVDGNGVSGAQSATLVLGSVLPVQSGSDTGSGGLYAVEVRGQLNTVYSLPASLSVVSPPVIVKQPVKAVVQVPGVAVFSVGATGTGPLTYQWHENGVALVNPNVTENGSRLVVDVKSASLSGRVYTVEVRNGAGQVRSEGGTIVAISGKFGAALAAAMEGASQAEAQRVQVLAKGSGYELSAPALTVPEGTRLGYQWRKDGVEIAGATSASYRVVSAGKKDAGVYEVCLKLVVDLPGAETDGTELARAMEAGTLLMVNEGPVIEAMADQTVRLGQRVVLAPMAKVLDVEAHAMGLAGTGSGVSYVWAKDGKPYAGVVGVNGMLTIESAEVGDSGEYTVQGSVGGVVGEAVKVLVKVESALQVELSSRFGVLKKEEGALLGWSLEVPVRTPLALVASVVKGDGPFTYQWRLNGVDIVGARSARYTVSSVLSKDAGRYDVVVSGATERVASAGVAVVLREALKITTQPLVKTVVNPGQAFSLSVGVNRSDVVYQWFRGVGEQSQMIVGGSGGVLRVGSAQESDEGSYRVVVSSGAAGRVVSQMGRVVVNKPAKITKSPVGFSTPVVPGSGVSFRVEAVGSGTLSYEWTRDGVTIPGANGDVLKIGSVRVSDAGEYRAIVRNGVSEVGAVSEAALLKVSMPVTITKQPVDQVLKVGDKPAKLMEVEASGDGVLSYEWRRNGLALKDGKQAQLVPTKGVGFYDSGNYDVVVSNRVGGVEVSRVVSRSVVLRVEGVPPADAGSVISDGMRANEGETVVLSAYGELADWTRVSGGSLNVARTKGVSGVGALTLRGVMASDAGVYRAALLSNGTLSGRSVEWVLDVVAVPVIEKDPVDVRVLPGGKTLVSVGITKTEQTRLQWYFQSSATEPWVVVPGATDSTYELSGVTSRDGGLYRLEASNSAGTVTSKAALVKLYEPVSVRARMVSGGEVVSGGTLLGGSVVSSVDPNSSVTLQAEAIGDLIDPVETAYQWYRLNGAKAWTVIKGATGPLLRLEGVRESDDVFYRVRALGKVNGGVDSEAIRLAVNDPVAFGSGQVRKDVSLVQGEAVVLSVAATGYDVHYQWTRDGQPVGTDSPMYVINRAAAVDAGTYGVVLSNRFSRAGATASTMEQRNAVTLPREVARVSVKMGPVLEKLTFKFGTGFGSGEVLERPDSVIVDEGRAFVIGAKVVSSASSSLSYQWRRNGVVLVGESGRVNGVGNAGVNEVRLMVPAAVGGSSGVYDVVVSNEWGSTVSTPVSVMVDLKPAITVQPADVLASEGSSATFRVESVGTGLSYRWMLGSSAAFADGQEIGVEPILSLVNVGTYLSGKFVKAVVSKTVGGSVVSVESRAAKLTVTTPGDITIGEIAFSGLSGEGVALPGSKVVASASVKGSGTLTARWRKDGVEIAEAGGVVGGNGIVTFALTIGNNSGGVYDLVVSNGANVAYGKPLSLVVDPRMELFEGPSSVNPGDGIRFRAKMGSVKELKYQWLYRSESTKAWSALVENGRVSGVSSDTLMVQGATEGDGGQYRVEVRYADGSNPSVVVSQEVLLTVSGLKIVTPPKGLTLEEGTSGTLSVTALNATGYRWLKDGVAVVGGSGSSLVVSGSAASAGLYQVEVSNSGSSLTSGAVSVVVKEALKVGIEGLSEAPLGSSVNLTALVSGSDTAVVTWTKDGNKLGTGRRLRISPVTQSDGGVYAVEAKDGQKVARAEWTLQVRNVPQILVGPATQSVGSGASARLFVVARYNGGLRYQWYRNGSAISGATSRQWSVGGAGVSEGGDVYTVRVTSVTDEGAYAEGSARVTRKSESGSVLEGGTRVGTDVGVVSAATWWVYAVEAKGSSWNGSEREAYGDKLGYWMVERIVDGSSGEARSGRSVWVWAGSSDEWGSVDQTVQEVGATVRAEYSDVASRLGSGGVLETFVMSGRLEAGGDAALYGAPEVMFGELEGTRSYDLELSWDTAATLSVDGVRTLEEAVQIVRGALDSKQSGE